jgi:hypothetical protein
MKAIFWALMLSFPIIAVVIGIELVAYRNIPFFPITVEGDPIIIFDTEIGFVPSRQGRSKRGQPVGDKSLDFHLYTDHRGARVPNSGEQTGDRVSVLFVGDSFTWGHGVEAEDTFAYGAAKRLNVSSANLALGAYGTTHSLQMLRRNLDLAPQVIVYSFTDPQLQRNVSPCSAAYYPFCLDQSYVTWRGGSPTIAPPFSNGVRRYELHVQSQRRGLWPATWIIHGFDVILGRILLENANKAAGDPDKQRTALQFLLGEMSNTAKSSSAELLIVYIPMASMTPPPPDLVQAVTNLNIELLNLLPAFQRHQGASLHIPGDGHPSVDGHSLIADEIASALRARRLLH